MMQPGERWARIKELFEAAADLPPQERTALLESECGGDASLRQEIKSLLESDAQSGGFIEQPVSAIPRDLFPEVEESSLAGRQFGAYQIIREVGRGGLGSVYLAARSDDEYRKEVAIKLVRRGLDTEDILRRFRTERQILAQLDHPNIARLIDGGTTDEGLPYFVMEYVEGEPVSRYCDAHALSITDRLNLFRKVCAAVTYAHQNLVIHRDLKPSNILVTPEGEPKLLDFGIAKLLGAEEELLAQTVPSLRVMTPEYASPEQVKGERVTTTSDVYSLGVLLYELLTGQRPYRLKTRTPDEIVRAITEQEPERPSTVIPERDEKSKFDPPQADRNSKFLRGDLDNIVLKAMRKEPARRYPSVGQFSEDIRRHLEGLPVIARKDTFAYRTGKFIRRHRLSVVTATLIFLTLIGGVVTTTRQAKIATAERDRARRQTARAERVTAFLQNVLGFSDPGWASSNPQRKRDATVAEALVEAARRAETELAGEPEALAAVHFTIGTTYRVQSRLPEAEPHLRKALEIRRRVLGDTHPETAQSMVALAEWHLLSGEHRDAELLFLEALPVFRATRDMKWLAIGLADYGYLKMSTGDYATAEALLREGVEVSASLQGADRVPRAIIFTSLGTARVQQGDFVEAARLVQQSIDEYRALPGEPRAELATALQTLGNIYMLQGHYEQAETLLREAFDQCKNVLGENHQFTAGPLLILAELYYRRENYAKALSEIERAMQIQQNALPAEHVDLAWSTVTLAKILTRTGALTDAEAHLRAALAKLASAMPQDHPNMASARGALGECLALQGRHAEAEALLLDSYDIAQKRFGPADPRTQTAKERLVTLYEAWAKPEQADRYRESPAPAK
jgi:serine/threonine-protein kinase